MFYSLDILTRKGPLAKVWLAATLGKDKGVSKRFALSARVDQLCHDIASSEVPLALRLSANLMVGVCRVYGKKCTLVLEEGSALMAFVKKAASDESLKNYRVLTIGPGKLSIKRDADIDAITLKRPRESIDLTDFDLDMQALIDTVMSTSSQSPRESRQHSTINLSLSLQQYQANPNAITLSIDDQQSRQIHLSSLGASGYDLADEGFDVFLSSAERPISFQQGSRQQSHHTDLEVPRATTEMVAPLSPVFEAIHTKMLLNEATTNAQDVNLIALKPIRGDSEQNRSRTQSFGIHDDFLVPEFQDLPENQPRPEIKNREKGFHKKHRIDTWYDFDTFLSAEFFRFSLEDTSSIQAGGNRRRPLKKHKSKDESKSFANIFSLAETLQYPSNSPLFEFWENHFVQNLLQEEPKPRQKGVTVSPKTSRDSQVMAIPTSFEINYDFGEPLPALSAQETPTNRDVSTEHSLLRSSTEPEIVRAADFAFQVTNQDQELFDTFRRTSINKSEGQPPSDFSKASKRSQLSFRSLEQIPEESELPPTELFVIKENEEHINSSLQTPNFQVPDSQFELVEYEQIGHADYPAAAQIDAKAYKVLTQILGFKSDHSIDADTQLCFFHELVAGCSKKIIAGVFCQVLVLKSHGFIEVKQDSPYDPISIYPGPTEI